MADAAPPIGRKAKGKLATEMNPDSNLSQSLVAPMVALGQIANLFSGGLSHFQAQGLPTASLIPSVMGPPTTIPTIAASIPANPSESDLTSVGDTSFDGPPPYPTVEDFLTTLDQKYHSTHNLLQYIPLLKHAGFLYIDDIIHIKTPETTFKAVCDMEVGTTAFIVCSCVKEYNRIRAQMAA